MSSSFSPCFLYTLRLATTVRCIGTLFEFIFKRTESPKINFVALLRQNGYYERLIGAITVKLLLPLIPDESSKIGKFVEVYKDLAGKLEKLLSHVGFLKGPEEAPFTSALSEMGMRFAEKLSKKTLETARELLFAPSSDKSAVIPSTEVSFLGMIDEKSASQMKEALNFVNVTSFPLSPSSPSFVSFPFSVSSLLSPLSFSLSLTYFLLDWCLGRELLYLP